MLIRILHWLICNLLLYSHGCKRLDMWHRHIFWQVTRIIGYARMVWMDVVELIMGLTPRIPMCIVVVLPGSVFSTIICDVPSWINHIGLQPVASVLVVCIRGVYHRHIGPWCIFACHCMYVVGIYFTWPLRETSCLVASNQGTSALSPFRGTRQWG